jgi:hypothetical protein
MIAPRVCTRTAVRPGSFVSALVLVRVARVFSWVLFWTWQRLAVVSGDTEHCFAAGRGLLNCLTLYQDVFDDKPPVPISLRQLLLHNGGNSSRVENGTG